MFLSCAENNMPFEALKKDIIVPVIQKDGTHSAKAKFFNEIINYPKMNLL